MSRMKCERCGRFGAAYIADDKWPHHEIALCMRCRVPIARERLQRKIKEKDAERGRPLTNREKLHNLIRAIFLDD